MATYSGTSDSAYYAQKIESGGFTLIENVLLALPDNTLQLIKPRSVRDNIFTVWENISFKNTGVNGSRYIGFADDTKIPILIGKRANNTTLIMSTSSLATSVDTYFYNNKADGDTNEDNTKLQILAGTNNSLFANAPIIQAAKSGSNIHLYIYNNNGEIHLGTSSQIIKIYGASGSVGMLVPAGNTNDIQINGGNNKLSYITGGTTSNIMTMGTQGNPIWANASGANQNFTAVLNNGNDTGGNNIVLSTPSNITAPRNSAIIFNTDSRIVEESDSRLTIKTTAGTEGIKIVSQKDFQIITDNTNNPAANGKILTCTGTAGTAIWKTLSIGAGGSNRNIQVNFSGTLNGSNNFSYTTNGHVQINSSEDTHSLVVGGSGITSQSAVINVAAVSDSFLIKNTSDNKKLISIKQDTVEIGKEAKYNVGYNFQLGTASIRGLSGSNDLTINTNRLAFNSVTGTPTINTIKFTDNIKDRDGYLLHIINFDISNSIHIPIGETDLEGSFLFKDSTITTKIIKPTESISFVYYYVSGIIGVWFEF